MLGSAEAEAGPVAVVGACGGVSAACERDKRGS